MGNLPLVEDEGKMVCSLRGLLDTHSIVCTRRHNFAVHPATWPLAELRLYQVRNACCYRVCVGRWWRLHPNKNSQSHCGDPPLVIKTPEAMASSHHDEFIIHELLILPSMPESLVSPLMRGL
jgi:hypothetical protein